MEKTNEEIMQAIQGTRPVVAYYQLSLPIKDSGSLQISDIGLDTLNNKFVDNGKCVVKELRFSFAVHMFERDTLREVMFMADIDDARNMKSHVNDSIPLDDGTSVPLADLFHASFDAETKTLSITSTEAAQASKFIVVLSLSRAFDVGYDAVAEDGETVTRKYTMYYFTESALGAVDIGEDEDKTDEYESLIHWLFERADVVWDTDAELKLTQKCKDSIEEVDWFEDTPCVSSVVTDSIQLM